MITTRFLFCITVLIITALSAFGQKEVRVDDLVWRRKVYYLNNDTIPFSGIARSFYLKGNTEDEMKISKGICSGYSRFAETGQLLLAVNYDASGLKEGSYLECNLRGDTLQFGTYHRSVKTGYWIERKNAVQRSGYYKKGTRTGTWLLRQDGIVLRKLHYNN